MSGRRGRTRAGRGSRRDARRARTTRACRRGVMPRLHRLGDGRHRRALRGHDPCDDLAVPVRRGRRRAGSGPAKDVSERPGELSGGNTLHLVVPRYPENSGFQCRSLNRSLR
jgi:hypothetical protein